MKKLFTILILLAGSACWAADPAMKFSLDADGYGRIAPDLAKGSAYTLYPYSASDGSLILGVAYIEAGRPRLAFYALGLRFDGQPFPAPVPPIPPPPIPPPVPPTPAPVKLLVVTIEESADSTPSFAQIRSSKPVRDWAKAGGHSVFFLDRDSKGPNNTPPANYAAWLALAKDKPLPHVIIVDKAKNTVLDEVDSPKTEAEFIALLKKWGGE